MGVNIPLTVMRALFCLLIFAFVHGQVKAQDKLYPFKDSAAVENIFARVYCLTSDNVSLSPDEKIRVCFMTKTNETARIYFPKPEYMYRVRLIDANGLAAPNTEKGERYGTSFSDLKDYSLDVINKRGYNTGGAPKPDIGSAKTNSGTSVDIPCVQEMFRMDKTDNYTLNLEFQIFKLIGDGTNHTFKLIRLPTVEIPVSNR